MASTNRTAQATHSGPHAPSITAARARARARVRDERGQALVELALVLPILLLMVLGIAKFALALNAQNDQTTVASQIARYAAVNQDPGKEGGGTNSISTPSQR